MYIIVREGNGKYHISSALGFYNERPEEHRGSGKYFIVLDRERRVLKKEYVLNQRKWPDYEEIAIPINIDQEDWTVDEKGYGCVSFLTGINIDEMIEQQDFSEELIEKCFAYEDAQEFSEWQEIQTENDADFLIDLSEEFHDAYITELEDCTPGSVKVTFERYTSYKMEVAFYGDVAYCVSSRSPENYNQYWWDARIIFHEGMITFVDDRNAVLEEIDDTWCWFRAKRMAFRIVPK